MFRTRVRHLTVTGLRVLRAASVDVDAELVVFAGANGSGKTSILESVHLLSTNRSFRSRSVQDVITIGDDRLQIAARVDDAQGRESHLGLEKRRDGSSRARIDGQELKRMSELARRLPTLLITPDSQRLLTDGSEGRRRLIDWLLFHVEPDYHEAHRRFRHALRQRNGMLRTLHQQASVADAWDSEWVATAERLNTMRLQHAPMLEQRLGQLLAELSSVSVEVRFNPGWEHGSESLAEMLMRRWQRDVARGHTVEGPHRADLMFTVHGRPARDILSRGESKLLTVAVQVAMAHLLSEIQHAVPLMLVDELASELDADNRTRFFKALRDTGAQTWVTTVDAALVGTANWPGAQVFELQQGQLHAR